MTGPALPVGRLRVGCAISIALAAVARAGFRRAPRHRFFEGRLRRFRHRERDAERCLLHFVTGYSQRHVTSVRMTGSGRKHKLLARLVAQWIGISM